MVIESLPGQASFISEQDKFFVLTIQERIIRKKKKHDYCLVW